MKISYLALAAVLALPSFAAAHSDIYIGRPASGTQTLVGAAEVDEEELNLEERLFESEMVENPIENVFLSTEPGFFNPGSDHPTLTNPAGALPLDSGDTVTMTATDALLYWDGAGVPDFVSTTATLDISPLDDAATATGFLDDHPTFEISGPTMDLPAGGIYLGTFTAQLPGLDASDEFQLLFVTGEEFEEAVEVAEAYLNGEYIPEPTTVGLLVTVLAGVATRRRR